MTTGHPLLEARDLVVHRGSAKVLDISSLVLHEKEVVALIGPNGAGKSTLLLALATLLKPTSGRISCRGAAVVSDREAFAYRRRLAMVFQEPLLFDGTVFDNVASGLKIRGMNRREIAERMAETLELFRMTHLAERSARKLSGGEAQRTSLARAFAIRPDIIFLDEPFSALDPPTRATLTRDLEHILARTGTAAIISTHDQMEALQLSDRMVLMNGGRTVQTGTPVEVMNRPVDEFAAGFVGMENVLQGKVERSLDGLLTVDLGGIPVEIPATGVAGDEALFCIRPENVTIMAAGCTPASSARNLFHGVIRKIVPMGVYYKIHLDCGFPLVAYLTTQSLDSLHLQPGMEVEASFKATSVHLLRVAERHG